MMREERKMNVNTVKELINFLQGLDPLTEVHIEDTEIGWSSVNVHFDTDGVWFDVKD
jgi:hypothetical protein